jgi:hypothetical protein
MVVLLEDIGMELCILASHDNRVKSQPRVILPLRFDHFDAQSFATWHPTNARSSSSKEIGLLVQKILCLGIFFPHACLIVEGENPGGHLLLSFISRTVKLWQFSTSWPEFCDGLC